MKIKHHLHFLVNFRNPPTKSKSWHYTMKSLKTSKDSKNKIWEDWVNPASKALTFISSKFSRDKPRPKHPYDPVIALYTCDCFYHVQEREKIRKKNEDLVASLQKGQQNHFGGAKMGKQYQGSGSHSQDRESKSQHVQKIHGIKETRSVEQEKKNSVNVEKKREMIDEEKVQQNPFSEVKMGKQYQKFAGTKGTRPAVQEKKRGVNVEKKREMINEEDVQQQEHKTDEEQFYDCFESFNDWNRIYNLV